MQQVGNQQTTRENHHYDEYSSEYIYMDDSGAVMPFRPLDPFKSYTDDFTVLKHPSGKIKLVGNNYSVFKNDKSLWNWVCVARTRSKLAIIGQSINDGYVKQNSADLTGFDFTNPPNL